jgi:hypothetical protein
MRHPAYAIIHIISTPLWLGGLVLIRRVCFGQSIVNVIGMTKMTPPIKDLLPRLTPILKNRHEKVQENCIDLVGRIADRGAEYVPAREWMRICFELLEMLKAHKKGIRCACHLTCKMSCSPVAAVCGKVLCGRGSIHLHILFCLQSTACFTFKAT